jgi:hypothetical protein
MEHHIVTTRLAPQFAPQLASNLFGTLPPRREGPASNRRRVMWMFTCPNGPTTLKVNWFVVLSILKLISQWEWIIPHIMEHKKCF